MVGEAVGVSKNAAANHKTIDFRILGVEFKGVSAVSDVAINDEFSIGGDLVTEFDDVGYKFIVGGDFAHLFFGAEMNGKSGRVLF